MERHLADCPTCREELAGSARLVQSIPPRRSTRILYSGFGVAAAAAIGVAVFIPMRAPSPDAPHERGRPAGEIAVVAPRPGATVTAADVRFVWHPDSSAAGYRVVVTTTSGTLVWDHEASDTSIAPPGVATFVNGGEFYWHVEAYHVNGGRATSRSASFKVVAR